MFGDSGFKERLLELVEPANLPAFLGGEDTELCPSGTGPWTDPAFNPLLTTHMVHANTSADLAGLGGPGAAGAQRSQRL